MARSNNSAATSQFVALRLQGTKSNRDAIGARVEVVLSGEDSDDTAPHHIQTLYAGHGYLSQSSKWLHFGLGKSQVQRVIVRWPAGQSETFTGVEAGRRYLIVEGRGRAQQWQPAERSVQLQSSVLLVAEPESTSVAYLPVKFPLPSMPYIPSDAASEKSIETNSTPLLVNFWASWCQPCVAELKEFANAEQMLRESGLDILTLSVDGLGDDSNSDPSAVANLLQQIGYPFKSGTATIELLDKLERVQRFLFARPPDFAVPLSLLLDADGNLAAVYRGPVGLERLLSDVSSLSAPTAERRNRSLPFQGEWAGPPANIDLSMAAISLFEHYPSDSLMYLQASLEDLNAVGEDVLRVEVNRKRVRDKRAKLHQLMAYCLNLLERPEQSIEHCRLSLKIDPDQSALQLLLGNLLSSQGELQQAIQPYEAALRIDPSLTQAYFGLGVVQGGLGNNEQAVKMFAKAIELESGNATTYMNLGTALERLGRSDEAIESYRQAVNLEPDRAEWQHKLSGVYARVGRFDHAIKHMKEFLRLRPEATDWHYVLAHLLMEQGRLRESLHFLDEALRLKPDWPAPLRGKAWVLATHPDAEVRNESEALRLAQRANEMTEHPAADMLDTLAAAYAAAGQYDRALAAVQQAIELGQDNAEFVEAARERLELYQRQQPYRETVVEEVDDRATP